MPVPLKQEDFPRYFINMNMLIAFHSKDKMFKVEPIGSNTNPGVTIDHYITRNMVLRYWGRGKQISKKEFEEKLQLLLKTYIERVVG